jgi:hypothetical protein
MDRYAYANNNAMKYTDPSGHGPCWAGKNYKCNLNAGQLASLLGNKKTEKFAMNYMQGGACTNAGGEEDKYCDLNMGGYLDAQHFNEGMKAWDQVESQLINIPLGGYFAPKIRAEGIPGFTPLTFNYGAYISKDDLRSKFINWYAHVFQPAFEAHQYASGPAVSAFHNEDIPSAVLGAYYRSGDPSGFAFVWDNKKKDYITSGKGYRLFNNAIADLGGGQMGSEKYVGSDYLNMQDCQATFCGIHTPRNPSAYLKIDYGNNIYINVLYPAPLAPLNNMLGVPWWMGGER